MIPLLLLRIDPDPCQPSDLNLVGTCFTRNQCHQAGGLPLGTCAKGFGVCCVVTLTCGGGNSEDGKDANNSTTTAVTVKHNSTYIQSKGYPSPFTPKSLKVCKIKIERPSNDPQNVCQVRLDFLELQLAPADSRDGHCLTDRLTVSGNSGPAPKNICGDLEGQHSKLYSN